MLLKYLWLPSSSLLSKYGRSKAAAIGGAVVLSTPGATERGSRRKPPESTMKWTLPNASFMPPRDPEGSERDALLCGVNSKDPQRIEFLEPGDVGDAGVNAADVIGAADAVPCTSRFPTEGANCRGSSPTMPTMMGLGLTESCR
jgi:hypothetical protein